MLYQSTIWKLKQQIEQLKKSMKPEHFDRDQIGTCKPSGGPSEDGDLQDDNNSHQEICSSEKVFTAQFDGCKFKNQATDSRQHNVTPIHDI